jgi:hypothetical protein
MTSPEKKDAEGDGGESNNTTKIAIGASVLSLAALMAPMVLAGGAVLVIMMGICETILLPLVLLLQLFGALGGGGGQSNSQGDQVIAAFNGDGQGVLDTSQVPLTDAVQPIQDAGSICNAISPIVIASQIEYVSKFDPKKKGPNGAEGISQMPPDMFTKYGKDDDGNGKTSAVDVKDSIMAQGRYLCDLAGQVQTLINEKKAIGTVLDLTLAAYDLGIDAITKAGGIPDGTDAHTYIVQVRVNFAKYSGLVPPK